MLAAMAAKHISAPDSVIFFETGAIDSRLEELPLAVGDPRVMYRTAVNGSLLDGFAIMQNRFTGTRGGYPGRGPDRSLRQPQLHRHRRLHAPGCASPAAAAPATCRFVDRTIIFMQHEKRKFVPKLDYLTSPGWLEGGNARQEQGLCQGGPERSSPTWRSWGSMPRTAGCF